MPLAAGKAVRGIVMQIIYSLIKFEPRMIYHQGVIDTVRVLRRG